MRLGAQRPRLLCRPELVVTTEAATEAVEFAESVGIALDPWQEFSLEVALGERADGKWAAFEVGEVVPRQNGKGGVTEVRELAGLFLFGERLIIHSAHEYKTSAEAFLRLQPIIENTDWLRKKVKSIRTSHGEEGIELLNGNRLRFMARTSGSGRGFTGDTVILDEAYKLPASVISALVPTMATRANPQLWYTSSAGMDDSEILRSVRQRAIDNVNCKGLAYLEWSCEAGADPDDRANWYQSNPAMGIRISEEYVEREQGLFSAAPLEWLRERLGIWDEPGGASIIPFETWSQWADLTSKVPMDQARAFAIDAAPDLRSASISVAGRRDDGLSHVEVIENHAGVEWLPQRLADIVLKGRKQSAPVLYVPDGPIGSLVPDIERLGVELTKVSTREHADATLMFVDVATRGGLRHLQQVEMKLAIEGARKRAMGDTWAWTRKDATADVTPLIACTLALFGLAAAPPPRKAVSGPSTPPPSSGGGLFGRTGRLTL